MHCSIRTLVQGNRQTSIKNIARELGIAVGTVQKIIHEDLNIRKVCAKFVPHALTPEKKEQHVQVSENFVEAANIWMQNFC